MRNHLVALATILASFSLLLSACGRVDDSEADPALASSDGPSGAADEAAPAVAPANAPMYWCDSGPAAGQYCQTWHDCTPYCNAGPSSGLACTTSADCQRICTDGPNVGAACSVSTDCGKYCIGNLGTLRQPCTANSQCGAGGVCVPPACGGVGCRQPGCSGVGG